MNIKKLNIIFLCTLAFNFCAQAQNQKSWWQWPLDAAASAWSSTISFFGGPVKSTAMLGSVAGAAVAAKWYWSPEKVRARKDVEREKMRALAKILYAKKMMPLQACWQEALKKDNKLKTKISKIVQDERNRGQISASHEENWHVTKNIPISDEEQLSITKCAFGLCSAKRQRRLVLHAIYNLSQKIADQAYDIAGGDQDWLYLKKMETTSFFEDPLVRQDFKQRVARLIQKTKSLGEQRDIQLAPRVDGEKMFKKMLKTEKEKFEEMSLLALMYRGYSVNYKD